MYVYLYLYLYISIYIYIYVYIYIYIHTYTSLSIIYIYIYIDTHMKHMRLASQSWILGRHCSSNATCLILPGRKRRCCGSTHHPIRPISLLTLSLLTLLDSNFPGNPLWAWEFHPFKLRLCFSQTLENPQC